MVQLTGMNFLNNIFGAVGRIWVMCAHRSSLCPIYFYFNRVNKTVLTDTRNGAVGRIFVKTW